MNSSNLVNLWKQNESKWRKETASIKSGFKSFIPLEMDILVSFEKFVKYLKFQWKQSCKWTVSIQVVEADVQNWNDPHYRSGWHLCSNKWFTKRSKYGSICKIMAIGITKKESQHFTCDAQIAWIQSVHIWIVVFDRRNASTVNFLNRNNLLKFTDFEENSNKSLIPDWYSRFAWAALLDTFPKMALVKSH